ncbi:MAG: DoxX family protein [Pseudonocardia sp.]
MSETTLDETQEGGHSRAANITLWALQVLAAAVFVFAGLPKVMADPMQVAGFAQMGLGNLGMYIVGALELAGAVALLIPRLVGLAALCFVALMIGAIVTVLLTMGLTPLVAIPAAVEVLVAAIAWGRRASLARLFSRN